MKAVYRCSPVSSSESPRKTAEAVITTVKGVAEPREEETENRKL